MLLDASALLAMLFDEPAATPMIRAVSRDPVRLLGAPAMAEREPLLFMRDDSTRTDAPTVAY